MLNFSHSDLTFFSPWAYVVFKTKGNALHLHLTVTILLSRSCLYFSHFGRDRLRQLACLVRGRPRPSFAICCENSAGHLQRFDFSVTTLLLNMAALCVRGSVTISLIFVTLMYWLARIALRFINPRSRSVCSRSHLVDGNMREIQAP